jgi:hypothetical protein
LGKSRTYQHIKVETVAEEPLTTPGNNNTTFFSRKLTKIIERKMIERVSRRILILLILSMSAYSKNIATHIPSFIVLSHFNQLFIIKEL